MSKTVFITGTSSGFGKLTAITLAHAGFTVIAGMRNTTTKNADVARELGAIPNIEVIDIDITSDQSVKQATEATLAKHGHIDVLINNAGVNGFGLLEGYSIEQIQKMFNVNFLGVLRTYKAVLPAMRKAKNGLIINITSGASGHTLPFLIPYLASKFGVESITEGMQDELLDFGIDNVSIQPGPYPTEMNDGSKTGVNSDIPAITEAYGDSAKQRFNALGGALMGKMAKFNMDPQIIADGILKLINMPQGKRPLRYPLDAIAQGTDIEFINARTDTKAKWVQKYSE